MKFTAPPVHGPALPTLPASTPAAPARQTPAAPRRAGTAPAQPVARRRPTRRAKRRPAGRVSRLLAWLLAAWLGPAGLSLAQVAPGTLPAGGQVVVGSGVLQFNPQLLVIQQNSQKLGLDWQSFNIGPGAVVEFRQPGADAVALNRVLGNSGTEIYGQLRANGQVFLTNPNGVLFAPGAKVDVGGLVASTLDLSQQDFADGRYIFQHSGGRGAVVNQGSLTASAGGYLALFGNQVSNQGDLAVQAGSVVLASGRAATVSISGSGLISAVVSPGALDGRVDNSGRISADGGVVTLSAKSAQDIAASLVNNSGIVRAHTLVEKAGEIWITGDQVASSGTLSVAAPGGGDAGRVVVKGDLQHGRLVLGGSIDASAAQGRGGSVETSAAHVAIARDTRVDSRGAGTTGTWLIDPTDFTIAAGGAAQTSSGIGADTLASNLANNNITLSTDAGGSEPGDIHVNAAVSWAANTTLTLQATRDINLNASISASGASAGLVLSPGAGRFFNVNTTDSNRPTVSLSGANATLIIAGAAYTLVRDLAGLQAMGSNLAGRYALVADIDASSTASNGFVPIGNETSATVTSTGAFTGIFDGLGHRITGLTVNRPTANAAGLFASTDGARLRNFELVGGAITGSQYVGAVAGYTRGASLLHNIRSSASVSAVDDGTAGVWAGGLVGRVEGSSAGGVLRSRATGTVSATSNSSLAYAGGLVGEMDSGLLTTVSAGGNVDVALSSGTNDASHYAGGLVGLFNGGNVSGASASGNVTGGREAGGLIGRFQPTAAATLDQASATGNVSSTGNAGGLVGYALGTGAITNASATGNVSSSTPDTQSYHAGGAVGRYAMSGAPSAVSAAGNVSGGNTTGGVVGWFESNVALVAGSLVSAAPGGDPQAVKTVTGARWVGGLIGYSDSSAAFSGLSANAVVTATGAQGSVGGLIGRSNGALNNSSAAGSVTGAGDTGGLVGRAQGGGGFSNVSTSNTVSGTGASYSVGGLVGSYTNSGNLNGATTTGTVSGGRYTGGVLGYVSTNANLQTLRGEGQVSGTGDVGGVIGYASGSGALSGATALGAVLSSATDTYSVGGAVGYFALNGGLSGVSAAGNVSGGTQTGGVVGYYAPSTAIASGALSQSNSASRSVTGVAWVGGIIGYSNATSITGLSSAAAVTGTGTSGAVGGLVGRTAGAVSNSSASGAVVSAAAAGGLVGQADGNGTFSDVSASGAVRGRSEVGGLVGNYYNIGDLLRATASGDVATGGSAGGLVGYHGGGTITDSSASGNVTGITDGTAYLGGLVGRFGANCYYCNITSSYFITDSSATGSVRADASGSYVGGLVGLMYSGNISNGTASGNVTSRDSISTNSSEYAGGLVGYFGYYNDRGTITGSNATGAVSGGYYNGGLVGAFNGAGLSGSTASGSVTNGRETGGLIGTASLYGPVENVSATGAVTSVESAVSGSAGGLIGSANLYISSGEATGGSITNASAAGAVTVSRTSGSVGGLIGSLYAGSNNVGPLNDSRASGNVSGGGSTGGLVGSFNNATGFSAVLNSSASGTVTGNGSTGGLVGEYFRSTTAGRADDITNSFATGAVSGNSYVGGLVGQFDGRFGIAGSYATGNVVGRDVTGTKYLGGLVGYYYGRHTSANATSAISTSYASGQVSLGANPVISSFTDVYAGGLVGYLGGSMAATAIVDAYASGAVVLAGPNGRFYAGGLVGYAQGSQSGLRSYASGAVSATGGNVRNTGGLLAGRSGTASTFTDSYWNSTTTGQANSLGGGSARTTAEMQQASGYGSWSLASNGAGGTVWRIYDGYTAPLLSRFLTPRTLNLADASKVYDGSTSFGNATLAASNGSISFPERIFVATPSADVGVYDIAAAGVYSVQNGYDLTVTGLARLTVTPRALTLAGLVADKVYDGTRSATLLGTAQPLGVVAGEQLTVNIAGASAVFDTKNVGQGKTVTITGLSLADGPTGKASNYQLADASTSSASVTPATLNAGGFTAVSRAYDGSTTVAVSATGGAVSGIFGNDDVSVNLGSVSSGSMADKNVGTAKPVTVLGATLSGADAGNYVIAGINNVTVDITPRTLTINGLVANNRTYNQATTVSVPIANGVISGAVSGDVLQLRNISVTGTMADRHAGDGKAVSVPGSSLQLRGPDAANYVVADATSTVNIARATVSLGADYYGSANDKVYDGTDAAPGVTPYGYTGIVGYFFGGGQTLGLDSVTLSYDAPRYSDKNVAYSGGAVATKTITVANAVLTGPDAGNYVLSNTSATTTGRITPRPLAVSGVSATSRVYDGTVNVDVNVSGASVDTSQVVPGDAVSVALPGTGTVVGTMANKNVGNNKPVTVPGFSLSGGDAGNYTLGGTDGVTANITPKALTAVYTALDKVYDGGAAANVRATSADIVAGDQVFFRADTSQYGCFGCLSFFVTDTSTPSNATLSPNAGNNKRVVVTGSTNYGSLLFGADAANYTLQNPSATLTANITPKDITPVFVGINKVYDGSTAATVSVNVGASGIVGNDAASLVRTATFDNVNAGTGKTITVTDIAFTGAAAGNYTLLSTTATASANITPKVLGVTGITGVDRAYDGGTVVGLAVGALGASGVVGSDVVTVLAPAGGLASGSISNKNVGSNKPVTVSGLTLSGASAANYTIDGSQGVTVNITPRGLTVGYTGQTREYNGGVSANVNASSADIVAGDVISFTQNAIFTGLDARNVGNNKPIAITSIVLGGADAANYALLNTSASATGSITPKGITVGYAGLARVYNGLADTSANVQGYSFGLIGADVVGFAQTATFAGNGAAGTGKAVNVSNITLTGPQAANYALLNTTATTTATVTPRSLGVTGVVAANRVYDGTTVVQLSTLGATVLPSGVLAGDDVSVLLPSGGITTGTMATKDAGNNKPVAITGLTLTGASAANYIVGGGGLTVNISPRPLTATYTAADRVYDGSTLAAVGASSADILSVDLGALGISAGGVFTGGKNAGVNKAVAVSGGFLTGAERNNYTLLNPTGLTTASITPRDLTAQYTGGSRVYDGGVLAPVTATGTGVLLGDVVGFTQTSVFAGAGAKNVASGKSIEISNIALSGADAANYQLTSTTASAVGEITPKAISIDGLTGVTARNRVYNGQREVSLDVSSSGTINASSADFVAGDSVSINLPAGGITSGTMADKNAGNAKAVTVTGLTLSGDDAINYVVAATTGLTVNIARKEITASYTGVSRVYDGTTNATATGSSADVLGGDDVRISATGLFTGVGARNAGIDKDISLISAGLSGNDASNYTLLNTTGEAKATITPKPLTPSYTGLAKVYDGSTSALVLADTRDVFSGDLVQFSQTALFVDKNVGDNKAISVTGITLLGNDAANYELQSLTANTTGSITPRPLRIDGLTGVAATDRVYDGTRTVRVVVSSSGPIAPNPQDLVQGDVVTINAPANGETTGTMLDKNVGTAKAVTVAGLNLAGADAANYSIAAANGVTVNIAPRPLTVVYSEPDREYDGSAAASLVGRSADIIAGDVLSITGTGVFSGTGGKNVGTSKPIDITSVSLAGTDAANYTLLNPTGTATGTITPRLLRVTYVGGTRIYDGSTLAPVTGTADRFVIGDDVRLAQTALFTGAGAKNVGENKAVEISAIRLLGDDAGNYSVNSGSTATTTASITPRPLRILGFTGVVATDRVYDGTTTVAITATGSGAISAHPDDLVPNDDLVVVAPATGTTAGTMADKNVGTGKPVTVNGIRLSGADAQNYVVAAAAGVTVNITPKPLTAVYTGIDRVYDGSATAQVQGSSADIVAGDSLGISASGLFTGTNAKNVGLGKTISITGGALSGTDALNYTLQNPSGSATANVTPKTLVASYAGGTRVYDGSVVAPVTGQLEGVVAGDELGFTQTAVFTGSAARNAGEGKNVQVSNITLTGADAANYSLLATTVSTSATVTPRPLNVAGLSGLQAVNRVYDGTRLVEITGTLEVGNTSIDLIAGDDVQLGLPSGRISFGTLLDKSAGNNKPVVVAGLLLSGADAANYQIVGTAGLTVNIAPRPVVLLGVSAIDRVYDGSTTVALNTGGGSLSGVLAGDDLRLRSSGASGTLADKNVGTGKAVVVSGLSFEGADAGNYTAAGDALTVNITPRSLLASVTAADKIYDGNANAVVTLLSNAIPGDRLSLSATSALFASANAGSGLGVSVSGITLAGEDAGNYSFTPSTLTTTASILRRPLTVTAGSLDKIYGDTATLGSSNFNADGLVDGESLGAVQLASAGAAAGANAGTYALNISAASGGNFNPENYVLSYVNGSLQVRPRPLTITANSLVRFADAANPASFGYGTSSDGLVGGDSLASVLVSAPAASVGAPGVSVFDLTASGAVFASGSASNYAITYGRGVLLVLPPPPRVDDVNSGSGTTGDPRFAVEVDPAELALALNALTRTAQVAAQPGGERNAPGAEPSPTSASTAAPSLLQRDEANATLAAAIAALLSGDAGRLTLPELQRLPLISFEPGLRRLLTGAPAPAASPAQRPAP